MSPQGKVPAAEPEEELSLIHRTYMVQAQNWFLRAVSGFHKHYDMCASPVNSCLKNEWKLCSRDLDLQNTDLKWQLSITRTQEVAFGLVNLSLS